MQLFVDNLKLLNHRAVVLWMLASDNWIGIRAIQSLDGDEPLISVRSRIALQALAVAIPCAALLQQHVEQRVGLLHGSIDGNLQRGAFALLVLLIVVGDVGVEQAVALVLDRPPVVLVLLLLHQDDLLLASVVVGL